MGPNFTHCGDIFRPLSNTTYIGYRFNGSISGVLQESDRSALITLDGCLELCGHGYQLYDPLAIFATFTTWILPMVGGLLLQAPFESNRRGRTLAALFRWLGSPLSSLTYVLWNIKILDKCALMVDMSTHFSELPQDPDEGFGSVRDSFYILSVMNQFTIPPVLPNMSAEALLRVALFSNTLSTSVDSDDNIRVLRKNLAADLRSRRRHGAVPVFISLGWFAVSLAFSIYTAFGSLGDRATALNLGLGLMFGWLPIFILACVVDRNPTGADHVQKLLNGFLNVVRSSLLDPSRQKTYLSDPNRLDANLEWIEDLRDDSIFGNFFVDFAGQGRIRWHYGIAHSILASVQDVKVTDFGRGWLHIDNIHDDLVLGPDEPMGLHYFDKRELLQVIPAFVYVWGTLIGAFVISYFTPTLGLGCRSGGYLVFAILALLSFLLELVIWIQLSTEYKGTKAIHAPLPSTGRAGDSIWGRYQSSPWQSKFVPFFWLFDLVNTAWLTYITLSQALGLFETCQCVAAYFGRPFGGPGGYIDFLGVTYYKAEGITTYWLAGTGLSMAIMSIASTYLIIAWCTQSHLSTENYRDALRGLHRTRWWKRLVGWLPGIASSGIRAIWNRCVDGGPGRASKRATRDRHESLIWSSQPRRTPRGYVELRNMGSNVRPISLNGKEVRIVGL